MITGNSSLLIMHNLSYNPSITVISRTSVTISILEYSTSTDLSTQIVRTQNRDYNSGRFWLWFVLYLPPHMSSRFFYNHKTSSQMQSLTDRKCHTYIGSTIWRKVLHINIWQTTNMEYPQSRTVIASSLYLSLEFRSASNLWKAVQKSAESALKQS